MFSGLNLNMGVPKFMLKVRLEKATKPRPPGTMQIQKALQWCILNGWHFKDILCIYFEKSVHIFNHKDICVVEDSWNLGWNRLKSSPLPSPIPKDQFNSCGWVPGWSYLVLATAGTQIPQCPTELACCDVSGTDSSGNILSGIFVLSLFKYSSRFFSSNR